MDNKEQLINDLRNCAEELVKMANDPSYDIQKIASDTDHKVSSERVDYMNGVMAGLGLE